MLAATYRKKGPAREVLRIEDVERPEPGRGEVRVRVEVSGVNPTDVKARSGQVPRPINGFQIPHQDGAGVIDAVGPGVDEGRIGERVWLWLAAAGPWGTAAEWTVMPQEQAMPLPDGASFELGASLGVPALTAQYCLLVGGSVKGKTVLVAGGAGAVGHFAIELGRHNGARIVTTVSSSEKAQLAKNSGADLVVDYTADDALHQIKAVTSHVDRVIEVDLASNLAMDLQLSKPNTTIVCYAATGSDPVLPVRACMSANVVLRFVLLYGVPRPVLVATAQAVTDALAAGVLTELPVHRFALEDIAAAHEAQEAGVVGKVLVDVR
ncbi:MAG: NADPH:quinone reductase [Nocardioidaceae bacterium]|nr:NADPH:quinone reductase [Nocardioidaceae bacterium]